MTGTRTWTAISSDVSGRNRSVSRFVGHVDHTDAADEYRKNHKGRQLEALMPGEIEVTTYNNKFMAGPLGWRYSSKGQ